MAALSPAGRSEATRGTTLSAMSDWTAADLPSFSGRTVIVTGANSGLGLVTARELARVGAKVIVAVRNLDKGNAAAAGMTGDVEVRRLDLQDLASVREFADGVAGDVAVLVNNAGIMAVPCALTVDGFESQIGTNHLGHFALTNLLLRKITERVVTVSSMMHLMGYISLQGPELEVPAVPGLAGVLPVQAREPAVHQRAAAPPRRRRFACQGACRASRLLRHQSAVALCGDLWQVLRGRQRAACHRRGLRRPPDALRVVPRPARQQFHRSTLRDARPHPTCRPQPAGPQREYRPGAVGAISAAHGHQIFALRPRCANLCGRHGEGG